MYKRVEGDKEINFLSSFDFAMEDGVVFDSSGDSDKCEVLGQAKKRLNLRTGQIEDIFESNDDVSNGVIKDGPYIPVGREIDDFCHRVTENIQTTTGKRPKQSYYSSHDYLSSNSSISHVNNNGGVLVIRNKGQIVALIGFENYPGHASARITSQIIDFSNCGDESEVKKLKKELQEELLSILFLLYRVNDIRVEPNYFFDEKDWKNRAFVGTGKESFFNEVHKINDEVIREVQDFLSKVPERKRNTEEVMKELRGVISIAIERIVKENKIEVDAEKQAGEGKKL